MFAATGRWFQRNRTPVAIGLGVVGAGYVATKHVLGKINDARERMSGERIARENLRRRFERNQEDCTYTVAALMPTAATHILDAIDTEKITLDIQNMKGAGAASTSGGRSISGESLGSPESSVAASSAPRVEPGLESIVSLPFEAGPTVPATTFSETLAHAQPSEKHIKSKRQLWGDLTISSITRASTLLYTLALLTMLTRIQLNLLGRRSYLSSVVALATESPQVTISLENNDDDKPDQAYGDDFEVNRKYLTFSWWLLNRGWTDIAQLVETAVRQVFGSMSPREQVSAEQFSKLMADMRALIDAPRGDLAHHSWLSVLMPPRDQEEYVLRKSGMLEEVVVDETAATSSSARENVALRSLLDETADLIESPAFVTVLARALNAGFGVLLDGKVQQSVFQGSVPTRASVEEAAEAHTSTGKNAPNQVLLPKILSILTRQAHVIGNGMPNEYLMEMDRVPELEGFAAVVYSSNWENEVVRDDVAPVGRPVTDAETAVPALAQFTLQRNATTEESIVIVDPIQSSFESAWEKASSRS